MIRILALILWGLVATAAAAQEAETLTPVDIWTSDKLVIFDAESLELEDFVWLARPIVIFSDSPNNPNFVRQMELLAERPQELADRDVIVITDTDPDARSALRLRLRPRGFMLVIMGKDGEVELRKPAPWDVREISRTIDKMPLRRQEVNEERARR